MAQLLDMLKSQAQFHATASEDKFEEANETTLEAISKKLLSSFVDSKGGCTKTRHPDTKQV
ncbi:unnamed protein product [Ixodes persulcatus]